MIDELAHELNISAGVGGGAFACFVGQPHMLSRRWCVWVFLVRPLANNPQSVSSLQSKGVGKLGTWNGALLGWPLNGYQTEKIPNIPTRTVNFGRANRKSQIS